MPLQSARIVEADGTIVEQVTDLETGEVTYHAQRVQPEAVKRRDDARLAIGDWQLLREMYDVLNSGGQAYWNTVAPDAGLPATAGAYSTALSFLSGRRDKAMSRALAAINRWRLA